MQNASMGPEAPSTPSAPVDQSGALPNPWASPSAPSQSPAQRPPHTGAGMPGQGARAGGMPGMFGQGAGAGGMPGMFGQGAGAGGMPGMGGMPGGMGGPQHAAAMSALQNPAMRQMMSQMMADPNTIQQVCIFTLSHYLPMYNLLCLSI